MDSILDKARGGQNALERLANKIPGFSGYRERELRRDADKLQREHLASLLEQGKRKLDDLAVSASRGGDLDAVNGIETLRKRMDKAAASLRYADRGYSGFFDAVKVDEAALGRVYELDLTLVLGVESVGDALATQSLATALESLDALQARLAEREAMLAGFK